MSAKTYKVKDVSRIARVTVRTLHHYDAIGLLVPSDRTAAGYRLYTEDDLLRLQEILLCRELGMPLEQIKRTLDASRSDRAQALREHRRQLVERARRTEAMIRSVDAALKALEEKEMQPQALFEGFDPSEYEKEAQQRWGKTDAYRESMRRTRGYSEDDWARIKSEGAELLESLAEEMRKGTRADDAVVRELAEEHRLQIDRWFYPCNHRMHAGLADLYEADPRFSATFDRHCEGLASYLAEAIRANAGGG